MRRRPSHRGEHVLVLLVVAIIGACGGSPDPAELARSARSWRATSQLVVDRWEHDAVSRRFTTLTLDRAASELQSLQQETATLPDTVRTRRTLAALIVSTRRAVIDADSAARRDDRPAARAAMLRLDPIDSAATALARAPAHLTP